MPPLKMSCPTLACLSVLFLRKYDTTGHYIGRQRQLPLRNTARLLQTASIQIQCLSKVSTPTPLKRHSMAVPMATDWSPTQAKTSTNSTGAFVFDRRYAVSSTFDVRKLIGAVVDGAALAMSQVRLSRNSTSDDLVARLRGKCRDSLYRKNGPTDSISPRSLR
jgi:hypothetical protein